MLAFFRRKIVVLSVCLMLLLTLFIIFAFLHGSRQSVVKKSGYRFGATYMTMNNPFYVVIDNEVRSEVEAAGDTIVTRDPALDVDKQIQQIREFISMRVRAILVNPVEVTPLKPVLALAKRAGIPVIIVDSQLDDDSLTSCTVISNNYDAGVLCAQDLMRRRKSADILLLEHNEAQSAVDRIRGFTDTLRGHPSYRVAARGDCIGQLENAMPVTERLLNQAPGADVIMALNDPSALGAMAALKDRGLVPRFLVYGVDGSPEAKAMVKSGLMAATAAQSPSTMAKVSVAQMYRIVEGKPFQTVSVIPVRLVNKANVDTFGTTGWQ